MKLFWPCWGFAIEITTFNKLTVNYCDNYSYKLLHFFCLKIKNIMEKMEEIYKMERRREKSRERIEKKVRVGHAASCWGHIIWLISEGSLGLFLRQANPDPQCLGPWALDYYLVDNHAPHHLNPPCMKSSDHLAEILEKTLLRNRASYLEQAGKIFHLMEYVRSV